MYKDITTRPNSNDGKDIVPFVHMFTNADGMIIAHCYRWNYGSLQRLRPIGDGQFQWTTTPTRDLDRAVTFNESNVFIIKEDQEQS